jgi:tight adherence protein B
VGAIAWMLADVVVTVLRRWRAQAEIDAESQMQDMLMMMPAARYINLSLSAAGGVAFLVFAVITLMFSNYNWKVGGVLGILVFGGMMLASRFMLKFMKKRRLDTFNDQLEESLMSMSNSLKAGFSIMQAIEMVIRQNRNPISLEFKLMVQQVQLGMTIDEALRNMADRVQSEDFTLTVSAITTARQTGGDLTGIFERLSAMIRERLRIQRRINSITAMGRLQGLVLSLVPVAMFLVLAIIDPSLVQQFFSSFIGLAMFTVVIALLVCGFLVIRKIVNIDI